MKAIIICIIVIGVLKFLYLCFCLMMVYYTNSKVFGIRGKDPDNDCYVTYDDISSTIDREKYLTGFYREAIRGYIYFERDRSDFKGFIILAHGFFGSHLQYMVDIAFLCKEGYKVLAFDQYGVSESDGSSQVSLANGIYVLENVIADVEKRKLNGTLNIYLYGHSWGAYSIAGALKNHQEITGAIMRSGFYDPIKIMESSLKLINKKAYYMIIACFKLSYRLLFGRKNMVKARRGIDKNHQTKCLIIHAKDDSVVPYSNSLYRYKELHKQDNVALFLTEKGDHNSIITEEGGENYVKSIAKGEEMKKISKEEYDKYILSLDRVKMYPYNREVKDKIISFLAECDKK